VINESKIFKLKVFNKKRNILRPVDAFNNLWFPCELTNNFKRKWVGRKGIGLYITRGPRGPWVAHLRKRSKVTVDQIIENPRGIIGTTLVEDL